MWEAELFSDSFVLPAEHCSTLTFFLPLIDFLAPVKARQLQELPTERWIYTYEHSVASSQNRGCTGGSKAQQRKGEEKPLSHVRCLGEAVVSLEAETMWEAEIGRELTWCKGVSERVPGPVGCIPWISPPPSVVYGRYHMLREGLYLSITPFLPLLHPALTWDILGHSSRSWMVLPWGAQASFLPRAPSGWFCRANPLLTQQ